MRSLVVHVKDNKEAFTFGNGLAGVPKIKVSRLGFGERLSLTKSTSHHE